jgi:hypothetical protein
MSERHTIVIRVEAGKVSGVQFCECSPNVTVEVRTYTRSKRAARLARPDWSMAGGDTQSSHFKRDEHGVYEIAHYCPDDDGDQCNSDTTL